MTLWKLAKSIAKDKSQDVEEVYKRLLKNQKKLRRTEDRVYAQNYKERSELDNS